VLKGGFVEYGAAHTEFIKKAKTVKFISWKHHLELVAHLRKWSRLLQINLGKNGPQSKTQGERKKYSLPK
jgi:hypothetical protein